MTTQPKSLVPTAGFVVKVVPGGEKHFVNVCSHEAEQLHGRPGRGPGVGGGMGGAELALTIGKEAISWMPQRPEGATPRFMPAKRWYASDAAATDDVTALEDAAAALPAALTATAADDGALDSPGALGL